MVDQQVNSNTEAKATSFFFEVITNLGFNPDDYKRALGVDDSTQTAPSISNND